MTGYGKIAEVYEDKKITIEIKSLNSKNFNPFIKIPEVFNEKEIEIKNMLFEKMSGGKLNFTLQVESMSGTNSTINKKVFTSYYNQLKDISSENNLNIDNENIIHPILKLPDVLSSEDENVLENEWNFIKALIGEVLEKIDEFRIQEGKALEEDIIEKIKNIEMLLPDIEKFEDERIDNVKQRLEKKLAMYLNNTDDQNTERFEQEIIYFLDKFDINEEKTRLINHCKYFFETLDTHEPVGTKLGFITQEIGREINTIGSKANHGEIQKIVVIMKDNLGKVKEQLLNVL